MDTLIKKEITSLRKELHKYPELSGQEFETAKRIKHFIKKSNPTKIIENIGETGLAVVYQFPEKGKSITIRCELDALPINEINNFYHKSLTDGVSHKCGHDGHMAIVSGLIFWIKEQSFKAGEIILLFQPAEESGKGAYRVLNDEKFKNLKTDYLFALHNIPKEPLHSIITMEKRFSAEVQSFSIKLTGKESHASEPENGINPTLAISELINSFSKLNTLDPKDDNFTILTPIHILMGEKHYGVSPANAELHYTTRTWSSKQMTDLCNKVDAIAKEVSKKNELNYNLEWFEHFPTSENDFNCVRYVEKAALENNLNLIKRPYPFKFGEDFGWFSKEYKTAMFGLGSGINTSALHNADYDFPDEIIETGINMFQSIISNILYTSH